MSLQIDIRFISMIGHRFRNFKKIDNKLWNCSCPLCGDSKKNSNKARGYFYSYKGDMWYKCHNCLAAMPFGIFLWKIDQEMHKEYTLESFDNVKKTPKKERIPISRKRPSFDDNLNINIKILKNLRSIEELSDDHPAKKYVLNRKIPDKYHRKLFLVDKFMAWVNTLVPNKFEKNVVDKYDTPRLIIPYYNESGVIFAFSGRSFDPKSDRKYILIKLDENARGFFGLDNVDENKRVYFLEGPINAMFIDNSIAMSGINNVDDYFKNRVIILDNDKRNKHIGDKLKKLIRKGENVCIWNNTFPDGADINDLILAGWSSEKIKNEIDKSTYSGLEALLEFENWRKY